MIPPRPTWPWEHERARVTNAATAYRLLTYQHEADLIAYYEAMWGPARSTAVGHSPELSRNTLAQYAAGMAKPGLYGEPPRVLHPDPAATPLISAGGMLDLSGWAGLMQEAEYHARGQGAVAVCPYVSQRPGAGVGFELLHPYDLHVECDPRDPMMPRRVMILRLLHPGAGPGWFFEVYDLTDPAAPSHRYVLADKPDAPAPGLPAHEGADYVWRYADGSPFIPLVFYRAALSDFWGAPYMLAGLRRSAFRSAALAELAAYNAGAASFGNTFLLNCTVRGAATITGRETQRTLQAVELLPGAMLHLEATEDDRPAQVVHRPAADPGVMFAVERGYASSVLAAHGLREPDTTRTSGSGNPTSAAALVVSDRDRREGQRVLGPIFRPSDMELIGKVAALLNRASGAALPEYGYSVSYHMLPLSPEERRAQVEEAEAQYGQGLISAVDLYQVYHPGTDADGAYQAIVQSREVEARLRAATGAPTQPTPTKERTDAD